MLKLLGKKLFYNFSIAVICTFLEAFTIPVFCPVLVMYFIILFVITMKRQIQVSILALFGETISPKERIFLFLNQNICCGFSKMSQ